MIKKIEIETKLESINKIQKFNSIIEENLNDEMETISDDKKNLNLNISITEKTLQS